MERGGVVKEEDLDVKMDDAEMVQININSTL